MIQIENKIIRSLSESFFYSALNDYFYKKQKVMNGKNKTDKSKTKFNYYDIARGTKPINRPK